MSVWHMRVPVGMYPVAKFLSGLSRGYFLERYFRWKPFLGHWSFDLPTSNVGYILDPGLRSIGDGDNSVLTAYSSFRALRSRGLVELVFQDLKRDGFPRLRLWFRYMRYGCIQVSLRMDQTYSLSWWCPRQGLLCCFWGFRCHSWIFLL